MSLCERPGCSLPGEAAYGMVAEELTFWIDHLDPAVFAGVLCGKHADSLSVPRGWTLIDRREPDLHLFSLRAAKSAVAQPSVHHASPHPPAQPVEQLQIDCGFDEHSHIDAGDAVDAIDGVDATATNGRRQPLPAPSAAMPAVNDVVIESIPAAEPAAVTDEHAWSDGHVESVEVDETVESSFGWQAPPASPATAPGDEGTPVSPPAEAATPVAAVHQPDAAPSGRADQLALALGSSAATDTDVAGGFTNDVAAFGEGSIAATPDLPPPTEPAIELVDGDELPRPNELHWLEGGDHRGATGALPSHRVDVSHPAAELDSDRPVSDEFDEPNLTPWMPTFDHDDDLGGMLDVTSPLLRRAFHGDDIS